MKNKAKRLALAGIGSAISLIFVVLSYYIDIISLSLNILATTGIMLILSQNYYREAILSVIVVSALGLLITNLGAIPFILVGGTYTIFTIFWHQKGYGYAKSLPIKVVYSVVVFFILYKITTLIAFNYEEFSFLKNINKTLLYFSLNTIFVLAFLIYDKFLIISYSYLKTKVINKIIK